jgi:hypothetical protein
MLREANSEEVRYNLHCGIYRELGEKPIGAFFGKLPLPAFFKIPGLPITPKFFALK